MAKHKLSDKAVKNAKGKKYFADGGGLYLKLTSTGSKSWCFRWWDKTKAKPGERGKLREMGLGAYPKTTLAQARGKAEAALKIAEAGGDPIKARDIVEAEVHAGVLEEAGLPDPDIVTFDQAAEQFIKSKLEPESKSLKHIKESRSKLATYASPIFGSLPVADVELSHVRECLDPIWISKNPSAVKLRGLIEQVLDWSKVMGYRTGENPARWRGNLSHVLGAPSKVAPVKHLPSLDYSKVNEFMQELKDREGHRAKCLELTILTAVRSGESRGARWEEIDLDNKLWTIPPERMKSGREHRVPLTAPAIKILKGQAGYHDEYVFPAQRGGSCLSDMAMTMLLRDMGRGDISVHGFRASTRTWAAETSSFPHDVCEAALSHVTGDKTVQAYQHSDLLAKRRTLMTAWAKYVATPNTKKAKKANALTN